jgi:hypothetical protein
MFKIIILAITHIAAFVVGALVFRNNKNKAEAVVSKAEAVAAEVKK